MIVEDVYNLHYLDDWKTSSCKVEVVVNREGESGVLNGRLLKQTFMSLSRILWKIWDYVFADVIHFCLTYLDFLYLMIGFVSIGSFDDNV